MRGRSGYSLSAKNILRKPSLSWRPTAKEVNVKKKKKKYRPVRKLAELEQEDYSRLISRTERNSRSQRFYFVSQCAGKSGLTVKLSPILRSLDMYFSFPPCSFLELKKHVFIEYVYLFSLCVETFPLKLAQGLYLACHHRQEYSCDIPRVLIL